MRSLIVTVLLLSLAVFGCSDNGKQEQAEAGKEAPHREVGDDSQDPAPATQEQSPDKQSEPEVRMMPIVKGRGIMIHLDSEISTENHKAGHTFTATMPEPLMTKTGQALPAGCKLEGEVLLSRRAARVGGKAEMTLEFKQLTTPDNKTYRIFTEPLDLEGESTARGDVEKVVGGAVGGAIIGGVIGGRDGAVKGGAAGGAAGGAWAVATQGNDIVLEAGQAIETTLARDLRVPVMVGEGQ